MSETVVIKTPQLGESIREGTVLLINKKKGDFVEKGSVLFELETEKVTIEVTSTVTGVIDEVLVKINQVVTVGTDMIRITKTDAAKGSTMPEKKETKSMAKQTEQERPIVQNEKHISTAPIASPSARKISIDNRLNMNFISGSGKNGIIIKEDVLFADSGIDIAEGDELIEFSELRKNAVRNSQNNQLKAIESTVYENVDTTKIINSDISDAEFISVIIFAISTAITKYPTLNSLVFDDKILIRKNVDICLESYDGSVVVHKCQEIDMHDLLEKMENLFENNHHIEGLDIKSTLSVSYKPNALMITPKLKNNQSCAITICRNQENESGNISMNLALSFDSRTVIDEDAIDFLQEVADFIENPHLIILNR